MQVYSSKEDIGYNCYAERFEKDKLYQVYCNGTTDEFRLKIPLEGTKKCVQVSCVIANLRCYILQFFYQIYRN